MGSKASKSQGSAVIEQNLKEAGQDQTQLQSPGTPPTARPAPPASATASSPSGSPLQRGVMVQVAALRTEQDARSLFHVLKSRGYPAVVVTPGEARAGDSLYRVQVGPFKSRVEAVKTLQKLGRQGFRPFIRE